MARSDVLQKKVAELLTDMKRTERDYQKSKKRAELLQKEKDASRSDLSKMTTVKEKLEKLCRELQKENKKLKVSLGATGSCSGLLLIMSLLQDDNKRLCETETTMREELHDRLEGMVLDVQEYIDQKENPESLPANMESDEL